MNYSRSHHDPSAQNTRAQRLPASYVDRIGRVAFIICAAACFGCSGKRPTIPVHGTVKTDGAPLPGGQVLFHPDDQSAPAARGVVGNDGTFQLGTLAAGDGAYAGNYSVTITPEVPSSALDDAAAVVRYRSRVNFRYQNLKTTPVKLVVKDDGSENQFDISVESSRPRNK